MTRTRLSIRRPYSLICLLALAACTGAKKDSGYWLGRQTIGKDSVEKLKGTVNAIGNEAFQPYQYAGTNGISIRYRLLSPASIRESPGGIREKKKYPLVLVLHGSGAVGTDNIAQQGIHAKLWARPEIRANYPAFVVVPQFPQRSSNYVMSPERKVLASVPDPCLGTALQLIDSLKKALPVDERRIYVTGFSMGASSTINSLELRPGLFAAAVSISGIPAFDHLSELTQTPIWLIHGNADTENRISSDSLLYQLMRRRHAPLKFWEIEGLEHDIYSTLYTSDRIPNWLFRHETVER